MNSRLLIIVIAGTFLSSACSLVTSPAPTPDVNAIRTAAAQTVMAEFTLTAASWTPTLQSPSETPTLGATPSTEVVGTGTATQTGVPLEVSPTPILCDALSFDPATVDVNIPDGTVMTPGQDFVKTWKVKNNGSCTWGAGYTLVYAGYANRMSGQPLPLTGVVAPGQEVEVSVQFKAPTKAGEYVSAWQMANANGTPFPKPVYVKIVVK